jgi:hypothetical protein
LPIGIVSKVDPARFAFILDTRRNIDALAKNIVAVNDDVANVNSNAKQDARLSFTGHSLCHSLLDLNGEGYRIDYTREFDQHAVTGLLDDSTIMRSDARIEDLTTVLFQGGQCADLVSPHQATISGNVNRQHRRQSPFYAAVRHMARSAITSAT